VSSALSAIPVDKRRRLAATLGLFAMLFITIGAVAATGPSTGVVKAFVAIALTVAVLLGLIAWGVLRSVRLDLHEQRLDAAIAEAVAARAGGSLCSCGHDHDPSEMHYVQQEADACAHDGSGAGCSHSCDTCVLADLRPSPNRTRAQRRGQTDGLAASNP
jgi:hypothetical protein